MKKNILIIFTIVISAHLNAMEPQIAPCPFDNIPTDVMNLIASFLTFDDVETEEEFIERKKNISDIPTSFKVTLRTSTTTENGMKVISEEIQYPEAPTIEEFYKQRKIPFSWLNKHKNITAEYPRCLFVYSPDHTICAMEYITHPVPTTNQHNLSIVNTTTNQELHNLCLTQNEENGAKEKYYWHLAVSSSGNIFATLYSKKMNDGFHTPFIKIKNLRTQKKEYPNHLKGIKTIAFNKQGTHLIIHYTEWNPIDDTPIPQHTIFPLTTTLDDHPVPEKTLAHYFEHKMVCKNIFTVASQ